MQVSITEEAFNEALGSLLTAMLPQLEDKIIIGQQNRVPSPEGDYVVFWPLRRPRLGTDVETPRDAIFQGFITPDIGGQTATMTITEVDPGYDGSISIGSVIFGVNIKANTTVLGQISGQQGGLGNYTISPSQSFGQGVLSAGVIEFDQSTEAVMQVEVHGANSADNAQIISTLFRSTFATDFLAGTGVSPLYADGPRQVPFHTAAQQYENRWIVDAHLQIIPVISVPQEFAGTVKVTTINVATIPLPSAPTPPTPPSGLSTDLTNPDNVIVVPATTGV